MPHAPRRRTARPRLESLEPRYAPAMFTVNNGNDSGAGSLRQAIVNANSTPGQDTINFNIPGSGVHFILRRRRCRR